MAKNRFGVNQQADKRTIGIEENVSRLSVDDAANLVFHLTQILKGTRGGEDALNDVFGEGNGPTGH